MVLGARRRQIEWTEGSKTFQLSSSRSTSGTEAGRVVWSPVPD